MLQADAYGGYNDLYREGREPGPVISALCWSHARRKFFELADIADAVRKGKPAHAISPIALKAVERMDAIFAIERDINGLTGEARNDRHRPPRRHAPARELDRSSHRRTRRSATCQPERNRRDLSKSDLLKKDHMR